MYWKLKEKKSINLKIYVFGIGFHWKRCFLSGAQHDSYNIFPAPGECRLLLISPFIVSASLQVQHHCIGSFQTLMCTCSVDVAAYLLWPWKWRLWCCVLSLTSGSSSSFLCTACPGGAAAPRVLSHGVAADSLPSLGYPSYEFSW